ncbi:YncE family protein [Streptomyces sp. NPDC002640]
MSEVFNPQELHVVTTVPVGHGPSGVAVDVHGRVHVTNSGSNTLSVVDASTGRTAVTVGVGLFPDGVATDPQFGAFVANTGDGTVSVVDRLGTVVGTVAVGAPSGPSPDTGRVAVDHVLSRAYVTDRGGDSIAMVRTSSDPPVVVRDFFAVPRPLGVAVDPVRHHLYVTQPDLDTVSVIDPATHGTVAVVPVRRRPSGLAVDPERRRVHVAGSGSRAVSVIDIATGQVTDVPVDAHPVGVAVDPRGNAYVSHSDGTLKVIDAASGGVTVSVPVGADPQGVAFEPHSHRVFVANRGDGTLSVLDLPSLTV